jgi:Lar family restriction alleviation protein
MPDTTPNLLPCPFCGSADVSFDGESYHSFVVCGNCEAKGPAFSCEETGIMDKAIVAWNQRGAWQPIETAPRDGTGIIGLFPYNPRRKIVWFTGGRWTDDGSHALIDPTHWQPLPSPPTTPNPHA